MIVGVAYTAKCTQHINPEKKIDSIWYDFHNGWNFMTILYKMSRTYIVTLSAANHRGRLWWAPVLRIRFAVVEVEGRLRQTQNVICEYFHSSLDVVIWQVVEILLS